MSQIGRTMKKLFAVLRLFVAAFFPFGPALAALAPREGPLTDNAGSAPSQTTNERLITVAQSGSVESLQQFLELYSGGPGPPSAKPKIPPSAKPAKPSMPSSSGRGGTGGG